MMASIRLLQLGQILKRAWLIISNIISSYLPEDVAPLSLFHAALERPTIRKKQNCRPTNSSSTSKLGISGSTNKSIDNNDDDDACDDDENDDDDGSDDDYFRNSRKLSPKFILGFGRHPTAILRERKPIKDGIGVEKSKVTRTSKK